jgi:hypothetical protein
MALDAVGNLHWAASNENLVKMRTPNGLVSIHPGTYNLPVDVTIDSDGNLYVAEFGGNRISKVTTDSSVGTFVGSTWDECKISDFFSTPSLLQPSGVYFDKCSKTLLISDYGNRRVRSTFCSSG